MLNTVIFDIGNVLADFKVWDYLKSYGYDDETNKRIAENTFESENWCEVDRGALSRSELTELMSRDCPDLYEKIDIFLTNLDESICENEYSVELIDRLKDKGLKVLVLSNYGRDTFEAGKRKFRFLRHIDGGIISCYVKLVKPEPEIYETLKEKYSLEPEKALFFDDRQENIDAAVKCGFNAVCVTDRYESILMGLKEYGIDIS